MPSPAHANPNYGKGEYTIELDPDEQSIVAGLREKFMSATYKPPVLPVVAMELLTLSRDPKAQMRDVLSLLEQDALLAGGVLKLAQSPIYQRANPVRTLDHAVQLLGIRTLSDMCLHVAMNAKVFRVPGYEAAMNELRKHSAVVAQIARLASAFVSFPDDYAYTCGLLHDAGIAACMAILADVPHGQKRPALAEMTTSIHVVHEEAVGVLTRAWKLPEDISFVLSQHHSAMVGGRVHPMIAALELSEAIAGSVGAGSGCDPKPAPVDACAKRLGLVPSAVESLQTSAEKFVEALE